MIDAFKFKNLLMDLEMIFSKLSDFQRDEYYKHLKKYNEKRLKKAITYLIETHKQRWTPTIAMIIDAIKYSEQEDPETSSLAGCEKCGGTGIIVDRANMAHPCNCEKGKFRKRAWKDYTKRTIVLK